VIWVQDTQAMVDGLITIRSNFGPDETMNRFEAAVRSKGMTVFAHVDHSAGAAAVGLPLLPTDLIIFGDARAGTPLMQSVQTTGIDLPLKALVWQDEAGTTWLSYNDPNWITTRHTARPANHTIIEAMRDFLDATANTAVGSTEPQEAGGTAS
jgi:uncharacterized protein (DUF302 family)